MAAVIAAIGLTMLVGLAGQLSLGHAFFVAVGAYGYAFLDGHETPGDGPSGLGLASLGLVFLGQHVLQNATGITGGYAGVAVEPFSLFGFSFSSADPDSLVILGVPYGQLERLWYLGVVLAAGAIWYGRNLVRSR